jgi:hypothetical protein
VLKWHSMTRSFGFLAKLDRFNDTLPLLKGSDLANKFEGTISTRVKPFHSVVLQLTLKRKLARETNKKNTHNLSCPIICGTLSPNGVHIVTQIVYFERIEIKPLAFWIHRLRFPFTLGFACFLRISSSTGLGLFGNLLCVVGFAHFVIKVSKRLAELSGVVIEHLE